MKVILFFTYGISLKDWEKSGLLGRELKFYESLYEKYNIKFLFITYGDENDKNILVDKDFIEILPLYSIFKKNNNKYIKIFKSFLIPLKLSSEIKNANIIKTNQLYGAWVAIISKILYKKPLLIRTGYDLLTFTKKNEKSYLKILFYKFLTKASLKISDLYLVTSNVDKVFLERLSGKHSNKLAIRPNWVETKYKNTFEERHGNKIISVGRLEEQKNYKSLINEMRDSNFEIEIYGEGSDKEDLIRIASENNVKLNINKPIDNKLLLKELSKYRIFVSTSEFEGNPKAILEAMANGCVVIAKKNENITEIIQDNKNSILFDKNNNILNFIENTISNKEIWTELSHEGIKYIKNNNSLEKSVEEEYQEYQKLNQSYVS